MSVHDHPPRAGFARTTYVRVACDISTPLAPAAAAGHLLGNPDLAGWFEATPGGATSTCTVAWTRCVYESWPTARGAAPCERDDAIRRAAAEDLRRATTANDDEEAGRLLDACAAAMSTATVEWGVPSPIPPASQVPLQLPLRLDRSRRDDATTIIDGDGAELVHTFGDTGEMNAILWRANIHPHIAAALAAALQHIRAVSPDWCATTAGARALCAWEMSQNVPQDGSELERNDDDRQHS